MRTIMFISHDVEDMKPISLEELTALAFNSEISDEYSSYLKFVLNQAKEEADYIGFSIEALSLENPV